MRFVKKPNAKGQDFLYIHEIFYLGAKFVIVW